MLVRSEHGAPRVAIECIEIVESLYKGILGRAADQSGLNAYTNALRNGKQLSEVITSILSSDEYKARHKTDFDIPITLPDLTGIYPEKYVRYDNNSTIFEASRDEDLRLMESLIVENRYYDSLGVWNPKIDLDKRVTAAIVEGLGARSCLELGCYSGPVLSVLANKGIDVSGIEVSHLALVLAYPNVHRKILFGNFLEVDIARKYDVFLGMDILEHLSPLDLDRYVERIGSIIQHEGFVYINSPMFGEDEIFGTVFQRYLPQWQSASELSYWRHFHCDSKGWPMHGHLVWASPKWWEQLFLKHGLVRDKTVESCIHGCLNSFFTTQAPARRSLFVLRHADFSPDHDAVCRHLQETIEQVVGAAAS